MKALSVKLAATVDAAEPRLQAMSEANTAEPALSGGWSRKQLLGHLIDSASNNHQRFVRAALSGALAFPAYDTDGFGPSDPVTLRFLAEDYLSHLQHHLRQIGLAGD